jgi:alpha-D-ribose 1-methylphosphonate 5-triphosphate synthase subunit PhnL
MRTLIDCPEILLLDEPTASLDRNNRQIILNIIQEIKKQNITMIGIFHDPAELEMLADEILPLDRDAVCPQNNPYEHVMVNRSFAFQV